MIDYSWVWKIPNAVIQESVPRTAREIFLHQNIMCSVSGGSDSDIMLDIVHKLDENKKVKYVFFDTGLEMKATKEHIRALESKYDIQITTIKPKLSVAAAVKKDGYPFISKKISDYIGRLQRHGFTWVDEPFDVLYKKYPKCKVALKWWCNEWGKNSNFNIEKTPYLKEFMIENPPKFKISAKCCNNGKKEPANTFAKKQEFDLTLIGIRKAEGGARASAYKSCMSEGIHGLQHFPLFWFKSEDKREYEQACGIVHSDAYTVYGCKRTGCAGCPFGSGFEDELEMLKKHEPDLHKAVCNIFKPTYDYTRSYRAFRDKKIKENRETEIKGQVSWF